MVYPLFIKNSNKSGKFSTHINSQVLFIWVIPITQLGLGHKLFIVSKGDNLFSRNCFVIDFNGPSAGLLMVNMLPYS
jgi:hypothetical protein